MNQRSASQGGFRLNAQCSPLNRIDCLDSVDSEQRHLPIETVEQFIVLLK